MEKKNCDRKNCDRQKELPFHGLLDTMYTGIMDRSLSVLEQLDPLVLYYKGLYMWWARFPAQLYRK